MARWYHIQTKSKWNIREVLNLLQDFLKERKQHVVINGQVATWKNINAGVPQLFLI